MYLQDRGIGAFGNDAAVLLGLSALKLTEVFGGNVERFFGHCEGFVGYFGLR